jgi:hypothetical protein
MIAWLIEAFNDDDTATGRCIGIEERGKISRKFICLTIPDLAIRFCRQEDAENAMLFLVDNISTTFKFKATEHSWDM